MPVCAAAGGRACSAWCSRSGLQRHMARIRLRFSTSWSPITMPTVLIGELDTDDRILPSIDPCGPRGTGLAQWTGDLLCFPIDVELTNIIGLLILRLPRAIRGHRPNQLEVELLRALHQGRVHIARIDDMFCGASCLSPSARWIGSVIVTSVTAASVVSTCVMTWSVSSSHVSVTCTLYPVQVILRLFP